MKPDPGSSGTKASKPWHVLDPRLKRLSVPTLAVLTGMKSGSTQAIRSQCAGKSAATKLRIEPADVRSEYSVDAEIPFEPERQYSASFCSRDGKHFLFVKGAPERLLVMSDKILMDDGPVRLGARKGFGGRASSRLGGIAGVGHGLSPFAGTSSFGAGRRAASGGTHIAWPAGLKRPPRRPQEGIISRLLWERTLLAGLVMAAGTVYLFGWELQSTTDLGRAQTVALTAMVIFQMFHIGNCRSESSSIFRYQSSCKPVSFPGHDASLPGSRCRPLLAGHAVCSAGGAHRD